MLSPHTLDGPPIMARTNPTVPMAMRILLPGERCASLTLGVCRRVPRAHPETPRRAMNRLLPRSCPLPGFRGELARMRRRHSQSSLSPRDFECMDRLEDQRPRDESAIRCLLDGKERVFFDPQQKPNLVSKHRQHRCGLHQYQPTQTPIPCNPITDSARKIASLQLRIAFLVPNQLCSHQNRRGRQAQTGSPLRIMRHIDRIAWQPAFDRFPGPRRRICPGRIEMPSGNRNRRRNHAKRSHERPAVAARVQPPRGNWLVVHKGAPQHTRIVSLAAGTRHARETFHGTTSRSAALRSGYRLGNAGGPPLW